MSFVRRALKRALAGARVLLHDPKVDRAGKSLAALLLLRALIYFGASAELVSLVQNLLHSLGA